MWYDGLLLKLVDTVHLKLIKIGRKYASFHMQTYVVFKIL